MATAPRWADIVSSDSNSFIYKTQYQISSIDNCIKTNNFSNKLSSCTIKQFSSGIDNLNLYNSNSDWKCANDFLDSQKSGINVKLTKLTINSIDKNDYGNKDIKDDENFVTSFSGILRSSRSAIIKHGGISTPKKSKINTQGNKNKLVSKSGVCQNYYSKSNEWGRGIRRDNGNWRSEINKILEPDGSLKVTSVSDKKSTDGVLNSISNLTGSHINRSCSENKERFQASTNLKRTSCELDQNLGIEKSQISFKKKCLSFDETKNVKDPNIMHVADMRMSFSGLLSTSPQSSLSNSHQKLDDFKDSVNVESDRLARENFVAGDFNRAQIQITFDSTDYNETSTYYVDPSAASAENNECGSFKSSSPTNPEKDNHEASSTIDDQWKKRVISRLKDIAVGKGTKGYKNYIQKIPKDKRDVNNPSTPDPKMKVSKAKFQSEILTWRRSLHDFDDT